MKIFIPKRPFLFDEEDLALRESLTASRGPRSAQTVALDIRICWT